jgi:NAD(P)H dehydrogenase (quinone)
MAKILILYYSSYGHTEQLAYAAAEGVREAGCEAVVKRAPELAPREVAERAGYKLDQQAPLVDPSELGDYDGLIIGAPTRFGALPAQMKNVLDQTGALWMKGALVGKVASAFTSTATQHGGQESTLLAAYATLLHQGMVIVGLPYSFKGQSRLDEITGCSPYGASTIAGSDGSRQPSDNELAGARFQGKHVADIARRLSQSR